MKKLVISYIADFLTQGIKNQALANSIHFIISDLILIAILLFIMVFSIGYLRTYISAKKINKKMQGKKGVLYHFGASGLGVISPFCSCSSIPLFIGFVESGIPLGITFSFLITSPLINEAALIVLYAFFGLKATLYYLIGGILIGVFGGMLIGRLKLENQIEEFVYKVKGKQPMFTPKYNQKRRLKFALNEVKNIFSKVWIYLIIGVSIGGFFHGFLPEDFIGKYLSKDNLFAVPLAVLIGVPIYSNVVGTIPIVESLISKGLPIGTGLAFLMSVTALSLPEFIILKRVLKLKLILIFISIVTIGIIILGYLMNIFI